MKLSLSIQELANQKSLEHVRFFGKILGTKADYFIVEAKVGEYPGEDKEKDEKSKVESYGRGANEYAYFASNSLMGKWTLLPLVKPEYIITARQMRRFFTGDLNAPVLGFPRFPWGEAAYLRAQISRIVSSTCVSPKGFYTLDESGEDGQLIESEEFKGVDPADLLSSESWNHHRKHLLRQGRIEKWVEPEHDDDDEKNHILKIPMIMKNLLLFCQPLMLMKLKFHAGPSV